MTHTTTQRPNVYALLGAMLAARDDAQAVGFICRVDESGIDSWPGVGKRESVAALTAEEAERFATRWQLTSMALHDALLELARDAHALAELKANVPASYAEALIAWHFVQREYEDALVTHAKAATQRSLLEDEQGRIRRDCAKTIAAAHRAEYDQGERGSSHALKGDGSYKPIAQDTLDKLAGDDPVYVEHRRKLEEARERERMWDARVKTMAGRVEIARVVAEGYHKLGSASVVTVTREGMNVAREAVRDMQREARRAPAPDTPIYRDPPAREGSAGDARS